MARVCASMNERARKSEFLQIRVTAAEKASIRRSARLAGQDLSRWVLDRVLPRHAGEFAELVGDLAVCDEARPVLAALHDFLDGVPRGSFEQTLENIDLRELSAERRDYLAAMVEFAARRKRVEPPAWAVDTAFADERDPYFASELASLRLDLLLNAPVEFRRRNLFVTHSVGARV